MNTRVHSRLATTRALVPLVMLAFVTPPAWTDELVRIATFNCEFLSKAGVHVKYGLPMQSGEWTPEQRTWWEAQPPREIMFKRACDAAAQVIVRIDADILALQEVGPPEDLAVLHESVQALGLDYPYRETGSGTSSGAYTQYVAVWSKRPLTHKIAPLPGRAIYSTEPDDPEEETTADVEKGIHVVFTVGAVPIHFYSLHLKSERGGHESDARRLAQATLVRRHCLQYLNRPQGDPDRYVIVAGDLNDGLGQPTVRMVRGRDDVFEGLLQTWHTRYFHDESLWPERWSHIHKGKRSRIDHVLPSISLVENHLYTQRANPKGVATRTLPFADTLTGFDGQEKLVSDHRPVILTLRFR